MEALIDKPATAWQYPRFELSFRPFVQYLKDQRRDVSSATLDQLYAHLINQFEEAVAQTDLPDAVQSPNRLHDYFRLATVAVVPLTGTDPNILYAFGFHIPFRLYHSSPAFERLLLQFPNLTAKPHEHSNSLKQQQFMYRLVLEKCYQVALESCSELSFRFQQHIGELTKYYQMQMNISFIEPHNVGLLPPLQPAWVDFAQIGTPLSTDIDPLPLHEFVFEGFSFFRVEDLTETESIQQLRDVFIHLSSATESALYHQFETALRNLFGEPDLEIGIVPLPQINGRYVCLPDSRQRSVFLRLTGNQIDDYTGNPELDQIIKDLVRDSQPRIFVSLAGVPDTEYQALTQKGIRSFLLYPIVAGNRVLGLLEMGSPRPDAITQTILHQIERVMPLILELLYHQLHDFDERLSQRIKTQFTPLQPAVEWKFYEAAWEEIRREQSEPEVVTEVPIRFPQVYPLYGAIDVRDSSVERQKAVRQDLLDQLGAIGKLLGQVDLSLDSARLEPLWAQQQHWQTRLNAGLRPDDEVAIAHFLNEKVNPYFQRRLLSQAKGLVSMQHYLDQTDPRTGQFNEALSAYERSLNRINATVNDYIDQEEKQLQTIYPHYFERYRTDGMEYTIYAGQSIAPDQPFERTHRIRLSEWQLSSMVAMARLTHRLLSQLALPLRTTQLILVHSQSVDISFRPDERRFDVEGSYSVRYEVLKKRIDKACIDGTQERLTQPDTIALVYTHRAELTDYLTAITRLQQQGSLEPGIEYVDLEPLQGVSNLRALRVRINYNGDGPV